MNAKYEKFLSKRFYRIDCPSPNDLGDYFMNLLPELEKKEIEKHLDYCLLCRGELEVLENFLELKDKPGVDKGHISIQDMIKKAADYIGQIIQIQPAPLGALRGFHQDLPSRCEVESMDKKTGKLELYWEVEKQKKGYEIQVQCLSEGGKTSKLKDSLVEIWQENKLTATTIIDKFCTFRFKAGELLPMVVRITGKNKVLYKFKVIFKG